MRQMIAQFHKDEDGTAAVELVLMVPILVWALLSTFVYFDAFRVQSNANRAALTVADMFSREEAPVTPAYLDGARELLRTLTFEEADPDFRITVYRYQEFDDTYRLVWTANRDWAPDLNDDILEDLRGRLPIMSNGDRAILVETRTEYDAPFRVGLGPFTDTNLEDLTFETFTVIRPRANMLCYDPTPENPTDAPLC